MVSRGDRLERLSRQRKINYSIESTLLKILRWTLSNMLFFGKSYFRSISIVWGYGLAEMLQITHENNFIRDKKRLFHIKNSFHSLFIFNFRFFFHARIDSRIWNTRRILSNCRDSERSMFSSPKSILLPNRVKNNSVESKFSVSTRNISRLLKIKVNKEKFSYNHRAREFCPRSTHSRSYRILVSIFSDISFTYVYVTDET